MEEGTSQAARTNPPYAPVVVIENSFLYLKAVVNVIIDNTQGN
jgi:hypothetical protein